MSSICTKTSVVRITTRPGSGPRIPYLIPGQPGVAARNLLFLLPAVSRTEGRTDWERRANVARGLNTSGERNSFIADDEDKDGKKSRFSSGEQKWLDRTRLDSREGGKTKFPRARHAWYGKGRNRIRRLFFIPYIVMSTAGGNLG